MSSIDSFDHVHVGSFNDLAYIYWPLITTSMCEISEKDDDRSIEVSPYNLLIGGGSGEHMPLRVVNDAVLVKLFIRNELFEEVEILKEKEALISNTEKFKELFNELAILNKRFENSEEPLFYSNFNMNDWPMKSFIAVNNSFIELGLLNHNKGSEFNFENVLADAIGAFILEIMPLESIESNNLRNICRLLRELKYDLNKELFSFYHYVERLMLLFDELNSDETFGRNFKKYQDAGIRHKWGYSLSDWFEDQKKKR